MIEAIKHLGRFGLLAAATFAVVVGLHYAIGGSLGMGARAAEVPKAPAKAEAPSAAAPAPAKPAPTMKFISTATIPMPTAIEVDGTVACNLDGTVLRCTARRIVPAPAK